MITYNNSNWLALDVGGANLKAVHSDGSARSLSFALWREPERLRERIQSLADSFASFGQVALTMTAELCDCFATKADGVRHVLEAVESLVPEACLRVWGIDGRFHSVDGVRRDPKVAAAANWLALAEVAARQVRQGPGLLIDIGSTTTDLIALRGGRACPTGRTDTERLRTGELVYAGVRRTPVCALATELNWRGRATGLMAELFATTLDVYLIRGEIEEVGDDRDTADGRGATRAAARDRLARMVGADRADFSDEDARELADAADAALVGRLRKAVERLGEVDSVVVSGSGEFLARRIAESLVSNGGSVVSLREVWGPSASVAACAYALGILASEEGLG